MRTGSIYAIQFDDGIVKIGTSSAVGKRLHGLTADRGQRSAIASPRIEEATFRAEKWMLDRARRIMIPIKSRREYFYGSFGVAANLVRQAYARFGMPTHGWRTYDAPAAHCAVTYSSRSAKIKEDYGMEKLTDVQAKVLRYVKKSQAERQSPPSRTEIARHFGWASANAAQDVLKALERKGYVKLSAGVARGIYVL